MSNLQFPHKSWNYEKVIIKQIIYYVSDEIYFKALMHYALILCLKIMKVRKDVAV